MTFINDPIKTSIYNPLYILILYKCMSSTQYISFLTQINITPNGRGVTDNRSLANRKGDIFYQQERSSPDREAKFGAAGIEPASAVYKTAVLPLNEAPKTAACNAANRYTPGPLKTSDSNRSSASQAQRASITLRSHHQFLRTGEFRSALLKPVCKN